MKNIVRLSQCMIVKNEEKNIERALSWGKDIMWEQIVVDTGSTDRTVEIAKRMGAKIYHFKWIDDFSAAKNFAIEKAKGNWIAFLDADEYLNRKDVKKIASILQQLENADPKRKPHILRTALVDLKEDKSVNGITVQDRFFRNLPELRYQNKIHELITITKGGLILCDLTEEISVFHTGYTKAAYEGTNKIQRNIELLKKNLEDNPEDYNAATYLAESYKTENNIEEAEKLYRLVLSRGLASAQPARMINAFYGLMHIIVLRECVEEEGELKQLHAQAVELSSGFPDFDYLLGVWHFRKGDCREAIKYLELALEKLEVYNDVNTTYVPTVLKDIYTALCRAGIETEDQAKAVKYCVLALRLDRYNDIILNTLLDILKKDRASAEDCCGFLSKLYDFSSLKDKLFMIRGAKLVGFKELDQCVESRITDQERRMMDE